MRITTKQVTDHVDEEIAVSGWIHRRRDHGKIVFFDLRDRWGLLQVVASDSATGPLNDVRSECVVKITGKVTRRPERLINPDILTGTVELQAAQIEILSSAITPPFEIEKDTKLVDEELRLKYRYLDLRTERMTNNLVLRHTVISEIRRYLNERDFVEVETPYLTKGTPEGAREFIVPSRLHAGTFYALPQSPQQFKQLLMLGGLDRYYQIARCFRDEDQRGDRQPEFTQLDLEMSFVEQEDVMAINEDLMVKLISIVAPEKRIQSVPFPRITYKEAMEKYGTDRPDLRENVEDPNLLAFCWVIDFPFFEKDPTSGGWTFTHNPFSAPLPKHKVLLEEKKDIADILTTQYDIVLNGFEVAGGSIRNHTSESLRATFEVMGLDDKTIQEKFGHMLDAFTYGAPPHGGIAWGLDRIVAILAGEKNIREVMAFPKTGDAREPMTGAPTPLPERSLVDAHISLRPSPKA